MSREERRKGKRAKEKMPIAEALPSDGLFLMSRREHHRPESKGNGTPSFGQIFPYVLR